MPEAPLPNPVLSGVAVCETLFAAYGRVRFRARGLRYNEVAAQALEDLLRSSESLVSVRVSSITGTVLLQFQVVVSADAARLLVLDALTGKLIHGPGKAASDRPKSSGVLGWVSTLFSAEKATAAPSSLNTERSSTELWHHLSAEQTLRALDVPKSGLSAEEAGARLLQVGPNRLPVPQPRSALALLWDQVRSVPVLLLVASAGISFFTGGLVDGLVISAVVVANAAIGFGTEKHAARTIATLTASAEQKALVLRGGRVLTVDVALITLGDILPLGPGAYIAADARLLESRHLTIAESALTGESAPVAKTAEALPAATALADRRNMVYCGTIVTGGSGLAVVTASGSSTEIGRIHALMNEASRPETPMEVQLNLLGRQTALAALGVCGLTLLLGGVRGLGLVATLQAAVSLAVAALPEGLPSMATTSLASGMLRMRKQNVLARSLGAVEAVGAIDLLCLDKTGTLTMNRMTAVEVYTTTEALPADAVKRLMSPVNREHAPYLELLLAVCALCSEATLILSASGPRFEGSATEVALLDLAQNSYVDVAAIRRKYPQVSMETRAEGRNYMLTIHEAPNGRRLVAMKGSPDQVLAQCRRRGGKSGLRSLTKGDRTRILKENDRLASRARRVLAMAFCELAPGKDLVPNDFVWLGLVGLADPPRAEAEEAIRLLHAAGIATRMITGDQGATAFAVGQEIGLFSESDDVGVWDASQNGDTPVAQADLARSHIFSRVTPSQKLEIVRALQARGHVVAMTGDGINDGPALKAANVGIALGGQSTETARESADLILRDDDLRGLLVAIREGRTIHQNIRKAVHFLLATNLSEVLTVLGAIAFGFGQPVTPLQLLWLNLVTDIFPVLALAVEPPRADVLSGPPPRPDEPLISRSQLPVLASESALIAAAVGCSYLFGLRRSGTAKASTMAFLTLSSAQLLHTLLTDSSDHRGREVSSGAPNYVPWAVAGSFTLQFITMFSPLASLLGLAPLALVEFGVCLSVVGAGSIITLLLRRFTAEPRSLAASSRPRLAPSQRILQAHAVDVPNGRLALPAPGMVTSSVPIHEALTRP